jgi:hypothetical protein
MRSENQRKNDQVEVSEGTKAPASLGFVARASRPALQQFLLDRLGRAQNLQAAARESLTEALTQLVDAELANLVLSGVLEPMPREVPGQDGQAGDGLRPALKIAARAILEADETDVEPFFRPKVLSDAILRELRVDQRAKWRHFFDSFGCLRCRRKDRTHFSNGMCAPCSVCVRQQLRQIAKHTGLFDESRLLPESAPEGHKNRTRRLQGGRSRAQ